jgi:hypothetical protein
MDKNTAIARGRSRVREWCIIFFLVKLDPDRLSF